MTVLMKKAEVFLQNYTDYKGKDFLLYITRDQTKEYFRKIYTEKGGNMTKHLKDGYGNPKSPINRRLKGLFFSARVQFGTGQPYPNSPYGPRRLKLPVEHLLTQDKKLYFSDFYCMLSSSSERHNITLVLCKPGSESDKFCKQMLPQLNAMDNSFLRISSHNVVHITKGAYVEIFYAEDMDISGMKQYFEDVYWPGWGREQNPQKDTRCPYCNL